MRFLAAGALAFALAACGDASEGGELAASNSQLSPQQVDAALGPADQTMVQGAPADENLQNDLDPAGNAAADKPEADEQ